MIADNAALSDMLSPSTRDVYIIHVLLLLSKTGKLIVLPQYSHQSII